MQLISRKHNFDSQKAPKKRKKLEIKTYTACERWCGSLQTFTYMFMKTCFHKKGYKVRSRVDGGGLMLQLTIWCVEVFVFSWANQSDNLILNRELTGKSRKMRRFWGQVFTGAFKDVSAKISACQYLKYWKQTVTSNPRADEHLRKDDWWLFVCRD